jgi:hypothetical protein
MARCFDNCCTRDVSRQGAEPRYRVLRFLESDGLHRSPEIGLSKLIIGAERSSAIKIGGLSTAATPTQAAGLTCPDKGPNAVRPQAKRIADLGWRSAALRCPWGTNRGPSEPVRIPDRNAEPA